MKIPKKPERGMSWHIIHLEVVITADIIKKPGIGRPAYGREMKFHLYPAYQPKVMRVYQPLCS